MTRQDLTNFQFELIDNLRATEQEVAAAGGTINYTGAVMFIQYEDEDGDPHVAVHSTDERLAENLDLFHAAEQQLIEAALQGAREEA